eukprot:RCo011394
MKADLSAAPVGSIVVLHLCSHNPTGADLTRAEWMELADVVARQKLFPLFDCAYQGYATGDLDNDAFGLRYFVSRGIACCGAQSFAKNFGLYSERVGTVSFTCKTAAEAQAVASQLREAAYRTYGSPVTHGSKIVAKVLGSPALKEAWEEELRDMAGRIRAMRELLLQELGRRKTPGDWSHITRQIGMFCYTGLSEAQCERMIQKYHVYAFPKDGRVSIAGLTSRNCGILADAIHDAVTTTR